MRPKRRGVVVGAALVLGMALPAAAQGPAISGDGRYVAFVSGATNLVDGPGSGSGGIFRRDRRTGTTIMVTVTPQGTSATGTTRSNRSRRRCSKG